MFRRIFFAFFLSLFFVQSVISIDFVPVYLWETSRNIEDSPALHRVSEESFREAILERSKTEPVIVVFKEETLSPEDFVHRNENGESAFAYLQSLREKQHVSYIPYVQNPIGALEKLGKEISEVTLETALKNIAVPANRIVIVDLDDAKDGEERSQMLERHDAKIGVIFENLKSQYENVVAIYTSKHTSWVVPETARRYTRSLMETKEGASDDVKVTADGFLLYSGSSPQIITGNDVQNLTLNPTATIDKGADNNTLVNIPVIGSATKKIVFNITEDRGYWMLNSLQVDSVEYSVTPIVVPMGFSYHCYNTTAVSTEKDSKNTLHFTDLQFQIGGNVSRFGDAYDCIGFTTVPIWSGLFVTIILLLILSFGVSMMMDVRTMDRFDDPKGKTITINAAE